MDKNDKLSFRNAYNEFEVALQYRPGDLTFIERKNEAYENAVVNVVVMPMENDRYRFSSYNNLRSQILKMTCCASCSIIPATSL